MARSKGEQMADKPLVRGEGGRFAKGNKAGGRKALPEDLKAAFRAASPEALATLIDVMRHGKQDGSRVRAAEIILDRGYGKPVQAVDLTSEDNQTVGVVLLPQVADLTRADLAGDLTGGDGV